MDGMGAGSAEGVTANEIGRGKPRPFFMRERQGGRLTPPPYFFAGFSGNHH